ncbi:MULTISPECIES: hypothetical protein [Bacillus]|uniref:hypothetical protein n=1 Tax=Bacillus TaxID=1386 RepID=UPI00077AB83F|nr:MULTISPECIES: hypothetical protein [Bacillus cereus group]KXY72254.1 hypothetical protein AT270_23240 [Bacillus cereus]MBG9938036.1 hypothetical protein [Bacillus tropicus]MED2996720.1 hypothetical protein [Bacillus tropicus]OTY53248.1 hypothetical protein BK748_18410 [Bacillus thuringiensis serovar graciosensis]
MELEQVMRKYETDLLHLPYVVGVGMGFVQGKDVIQVFVSKKVPRSQLKAAEQIPIQLETYPTNIIEVGTITNHYTG